MSLNPPNPDASKNIFVGQFRDKLPEPEYISKLEKLAKPETFKTIHSMVEQVKTHLQLGGFNIGVTSGNSGFLSQVLLEDAIKIVPMTDINKRYSDPELIWRALENSGVSITRSNLAYLDEIIIGVGKAKKCLTAMSSLPLRDFGFISIVGPSYLHNPPQSTDDYNIKEKLKDRPDLLEKLYFPQIISSDAWNLMYGLEELADHYGESIVTKNFIDHILESILNSQNHV